MCCHNKPSSLCFLLSFFVFCFLTSRSFFHNNKKHFLHHAGNLTSRDVARMLQKIISRKSKLFKWMLAFRWGLWWFIYLVSLSRLNLSENLENFWQLQSVPNSFWQTIIYCANFVSMTYLFSLLCIAFYVVIGKHLVW